MELEVNKSQDTTIERSVVWYKMRGNKLTTKSITKMVTSYQKFCCYGTFHHRVAYSL